MYRDRKIMNLPTKLLCVAMFFFPLFSSPSALAQTDNRISTAKDAVYGEAGVDVLYSHTSGVSLFVHSQGVGVNGRWGRFVTAKASRSFAFDLYFTKHLREEMTANPVYPEALPYVFGKSNSMFSLRFLREHRKELSPKLRFGAVQVGTVARYGFSLGFLKPVYLYIGIPEIPYEQIITVEYNPEEHFYDDIYGRAPWVNGLDELTVVPGIHLGGGLTFEYSSQRGYTKSVEIGTMFDAYLNEMEILASDFVDPQRLFLSLYIKLEMGSCWTDAR